VDQTSLPRLLFQEAKRWARGRGIPTNVPWRQLTAEQRRLILEGDPENEYEGVKGFFNLLERKKYKLHVRVFLSRFRGYAKCPECGGTRLRAEARAVRVAGKAITEVCKLTVKEARAFFSTLELSEGPPENRGQNSGRDSNAGCSFWMKWASITSRSTG